MPFGKDGEFPSTERRVRSFLFTQGIKTQRISARGGWRTAVSFSDLPPETQIALLQRRAGIDPAGTNPAIWEEFGKTTPKTISEAKQRHTIICAVQARIDRGVTRGRALSEASKETGVPTITLRRWYSRVDDVPRADWLPALAPSWEPGGKKAEMSEEAWRFFLSYIEQASAHSTLKRAHRETQEAAVLNGWAWPTYDTVMRYWRLTVDTGTKALLRSGAKAFDKTVPTMERSVAHLQAMEIVNLDGRMADLFVTWEDGTVSRPIVIAIQDVYSRKMLGWRVSKTEDADTTKLVVLDVIDHYGLFDGLRTDNGRAFASRKVSGGAAHRFRGKKSEDEPPGILTLMGAQVGFALPESGRSKPIERAFRDVAYDIDTCPEFRDAYCGHRPDAKPEDFAEGAVPIALFREVYERELNAHNARPGRRTEMGKGKLSFDQVFAESYAQRPRRDITAAQRRFFLLDMAYLKPNKDTGALTSNGFRYWAAEHQTALLAHRHGKVAVLFDPRDRSKPVMVLNREGRMIIDSLPCLKRGKFDSTEDARQHARGKGQRLKAARADKKGLNLMNEAELNNLRKRSQDARPAPVPPASDTNITAPLFGLPGAAAKATTSGAEIVTPDFGTVPEEPNTRARELEAGLQRLVHERLQERQRFAS